MRSATLSAPSSTSCRSRPSASAAAGVGGRVSGGLLFTPGRIGPVETRNRIVRAGTSETMAGPDGEITAGLVDLYEALARNGVGLLLTGHLFVTDAGGTRSTRPASTTMRFCPVSPASSSGCIDTGPGSSPSSPTRAASPACRPTIRWRRRRCPTSSRAARSERRSRRRSTRRSRRSRELRHGPSRPASTASTSTERTAT